jgi:hypothetical protein
VSSATIDDRRFNPTSHDDADHIAIPEFAKLGTSCKVGTGFLVGDMAGLSAGLHSSADTLRVNDSQRKSNAGRAGHTSAQQ